MCCPPRCAQSSPGASPGRVVYTTPQSNYSEHPPQKTKTQRLQSFPPVFGGVLNISRGVPLFSLVPGDHLCPPDQPPKVHLPVGVMSRQGDLRGVCAAHCGQGEGPRASQGSILPPPHILCCCTLQQIQGKDPKFCSANTMKPKLLVESPISEWINLGGDCFSCRGGLLAGLCTFGRAAFESFFGGRVGLLHGGILGSHCKILCTP